VGLAYSRLVFESIRSSDGAEILFWLSAQLNELQKTYSVNEFFRIEPFLFALSLVQTADIDDQFLQILDVLVENQSEVHLFPEYVPLDVVSQIGSDGVRFCRRQLVGTVYGM
jgi:hypothetical protein